MPAPEKKGKPVKPEKLKEPRVQPASQPRKTHAQSGAGIPVVIEIIGDSDVTSKTPGVKIVRKGE